MNGLAPAAVMPEDIAFLVFIAMICIIPLVTILTRHQQRMTELLRTNGRNDREDQLAQEIAALRQLVYQQALSIDSLAMAQKQLLDRQSVVDPVVQLQARASSPPPMPNGPEARTP